MYCREGISLFVALALIAVFIASQIIREEIEYKIERHQESVEHHHEKKIHDCQCQEYEAMQKMRRC